MNNSWLYRILSLGCGAVMLQLASSNPALAQRAYPDQDSPLNQSAAVPLSSRSPLALPELPSIQPLLPELASTIQVVLRLGERRVYVYDGETLRGSYPVAIGKPGWETPTGQFQVIQMLENPGWTHPFTGEVVPPGPENPLGERWIAFWTDGTNYIGFHGTPNRNSVGQAASHGCVRLFNEDIRVLYNQVEPGTLVVVEP